MAREMKHSGIKWNGDIPNDWICQRLKFSLSANDGGVWGEDPQEEGNTIVLRSTEQTIDGKWDIQDPALRYLQSTPNYKLCLCKKGDLLVTKSSGSKAHIGKTSLVTQEIEDMECCYSNFLQRLHLANERDERFFWYILNSNVTRLQFAYRQNSTSGIGNINSTDIDSVFVPVPPFLEQQAIADFLDTKCAEIDGLLEDLDKEVKTLAEYKKSIIAETVTRGLNPKTTLVPTNHGWIDKIPMHWVLEKAKYAFELRRTKGNLKNLELLSPTQKYGVIPQSQLEGVVLVNEKTNLETFRTIHVGDFCISLRSFQGGFEYSTYEGVVSPAYQVFYPTIKVCDRYYKYLFKSDGFISKINTFSMSLRDGKNIAFEDFGNMYIPVPPQAEQIDIAEYLDEKCDLIEKSISDKLLQIDKLKEYKASLIYEYVTGKKQVI